jgi:tRNA pseudouridine38-40 synthase
VLPKDVWVARAHEMRDDFHARFSATSRRYSYYVGTDDDAQSPFRRDREWPVEQFVEREHLDAAAEALHGEHSFRAFAVQGTAPAEDDHRCDVRHARWRERSGGLVFEIESNRFLHHMVRFLVGTMLEMATGRRPVEEMQLLLEAHSNRDVSPPAPPHALFLERVEYPADLYVSIP